MISMTPKCRPADREILRDAARVLRSDRRDSLTGTVVSPGTFFREGRSPFGTKETVCLVVLVWGRQPRQFGTFLTQSGHSDDSARATSEGESREDRTPVVV